VIHHGDCIEVMATFEAESIDAIVTDPPYGLEFMGKGWDKLGATTEVAAEGADISHPFRDGSRRVRYGESARSMQDWHEAWAREAFRVAKPGAHLLAFGGTRTYHRLAAAIEDAGWEIRDTLVWAYASGFPKSLDVSKAIDKAAGATDLAREWQGWGTALKPAWEPIVLARKPLRGTVAGNVTEYGTGALNIDGCRIAAPENVGVTWTRCGKQTGASLTTNTTGEPEYVEANPAGRWPANVILTDPIFDGDTPGVVGGGEDKSQTATYRNDSQNNGYHGIGVSRAGTTVGFGDSGTYSRFFLIPKAARTDREPVISPLRVDSSRHNQHPTVKPTDLMRHLVRLVTPPGGTVLDPFLGSGTTALAAEMEGFEWIGIEREAEYVAIAEARLNGTQRGLGLTG
jgi:DNA modification methylase